MVVGDEQPIGYFRIQQFLGESKRLLTQIPPQLNSLLDRLGLLHLFTQPSSMGLWAEAVARKIRLNPSSPRENCSRGGELRLEGCSDAAPVRASPSNGRLRIDSMFTDTCCWTSRRVRLELRPGHVCCPPCQGRGIRMYSHVKMVNATSLDVGLRCAACLLVDQSEPLAPVKRLPVMSCGGVLSRRIFRASRLSTRANHIQPKTSVKEFHLVNAACGSGRSNICRKG
jgi:hypothetical protein